MFKIQKELVVKNWPATVEIPTDGGKVIKENITLDLLILDLDENGMLLNGNKKTMKKVIKGWSGIGDENGKPLEFSQENLDEVIQNQFFAVAVLRAYQMASNGQAAEKN